jgi:hypothetical protein
MGSFAEALTYLPLAIIGLAAVAGARHLFLSSGPSLKVFAKVWIALFVFEVAGHVLALFFTNQWFYNILQAGWVLALSFIYLHVLANNRMKSLIQVFMALFAVFYIMNSLFIQGFDDLQSITYA